MICQVIAGAIGLLVTLPLLYLLFDREPVFRLTHIWIEPEKVMPGQAVYIMLNGIEFRDCPGVISRQIIDSTGRIYTYAREPRQLEHVKTETRVYKLPFVLPLGLAPGRGRYRSEVHRWCNWLQKVVWPISSTYEATFEVIGEAEQH